MAPRPNKRRPASRRRWDRRPPPRRNWRLVAAGALIAVVFVGLGALLYVKGPRLKELVNQRVAGLESVPPYEQPHELPDQIARIDHAFYVTLFRLGVKARDVRFVHVERRRHQGREWEQARVKVGLPERVSFERVKTSLERALTPLGEELELAWVPQGRQERLEVRWGGLLTHQVDFSAGPLKAARPRGEGELPRVVLVMDDLGYDERHIERLVALKLPVTCSVLPYSPHGRQVLRQASEAGLECLLHLPMEAEGLPVKKLGEGALLMEMDAGQLLRRLRDNLEELPGVTGVNNHMGSRLTANEPRMKVVLAELKRRGLLFLDSRTTPRSRGYELARQMGVRSADRDIFLDTVQRKGAVLAQLNKLISLAESRGEAVAICHPYPETFEALEEAAPRLRSQVRLVKVVELAR